jgi:hypothetical protein
MRQAGTAQRSALRDKGIGFIFTGTDSKAISILLRWPGMVNGEEHLWSRE